MPIEHYLLDAIDLVLARELPDEVFADAVNDQASLMARVNPEERWEL
jgi:hypothetical protein